MKTKKHYAKGILVGTFTLAIMTALVPALGIQAGLSLKESNIFVNIINSLCVLASVIYCYLKFREKEKA